MENGRKKDTDRNRHENLHVEKNLENLYSL